MLIAHNQMLAVIVEADGRIATNFFVQPKEEFSLLLLQVPDLKGIPARVSDVSDDRVFLRRIERNGLVLLQVRKM